MNNLYYVCLCICNYYVFLLLSSSPSVQFPLSLVVINNSKVAITNKALVPMGNAVNVVNMSATCHQQQTNRRQDSQSGLLCSLLLPALRSG